MRRRYFITLLGAWPFAAHAQQNDRMRRIGVLMSTGAGNPDYRPASQGSCRVAEFGWSVGRNVRIDIRWPAGDTYRHRQYAAELIGLAPDVILATGSASMAPLKQATLTADRVHDRSRSVRPGFVDSLARPGGNITGFPLVRIRHQRQIAEFLKQIAPGGRERHHSRSSHFRGNWAVRCYYIGGTVARRGSRSDQCERSQRD